MQSALTHAQKRDAPRTTHFVNPNTAPIALISVPNSYCTRPGTNVIAICVPENTPVSQKSISAPPFLMRLRTVTAPWSHVQRPACVSSFCNIRSNSSCPDPNMFPAKVAHKAPFYQGRKLLAKPKSFYQDQKS